MCQEENVEERRTWRRREERRGVWVFVAGLMTDRLNAHSARPQRLSVTLEDELPRHRLRPSAVPRRINPPLFVRGPRGCNTFCCCARGACTFSVAHRACEAAFAVMWACAGPRWSAVIPSPSLVALPREERRPGESGAAHAPSLEPPAHSRWHVNIALA